MTKRKEDPDGNVIRQVMRVMGRKGGKIGGKKRMESMTPEQRSEFGRRAVQARWAKQFGTSTIQKYPWDRTGIDQ